jgi:radical SAM-linked protein
LLVAAYERGCRFDGWSEAFRWETWNEAITASGIDPEEYLRRRNLDETLPWDHLDAGLAKKWLQQELRRALEGRLTPDCSIENCTYCGACDFTSIRNVTYHREGAKGSEHRGGDVDPWARAQVSGDEEWETRAWQKIVARKTAKAERLRARRDGATPPQAASASGAPAPVADDAVEPAPLSPRATAEAEAPRRGSGNAEEWLEGDPSALPARPTGVAPPPAAARYRLRYRKVRLARFIGNLELIGVLGRAARRAGLPLAYSGGHHPLPRMSFGPALPVGVESDSELFDLELTRAMPSDEIERRLGPALPPDLELVSVEPIALRAASIESGIESLRFRVDLAPLGNLGTIDLPGRVAAFAAGSPLAVRRRKDREATVDAHEYIRALRLVSDTALEVEIRFGPTGSLKPSSFVEALLALPADDSRRLRIRKLDAPAPPYA